MHLTKNHSAFVLLYLIAHRARRNAAPLLGLEKGESFVGDFREHGFTEGSYRWAKKFLNHNRLATFRTTPKGTIAKLTDSRIYDINILDNDGQHTTITTPQRRANDGLTTTNKNERIKEWKKVSSRFAPPTLSEIQKYIQSGNDDAPYQVSPEKFLAYYESNGWMVGKNKMKNWKAAIRTWHQSNVEKINGTAAPRPKSRCLNYES